MSDPLWTKSYLPLARRLLFYANHCFFVFRLFSKINSFEMVQNFLENIKTNLIWFIIRKDGVCVF